MVLPEGPTGTWTNQPNGGPRWADYVVQDVVGHVDGTFPTDARPERRAIGGLATAGAGAQQLAQRYANVFRSVSGNSPALRSFAEAPEQYLGEYLRVFAQALASRPS